MADVVLEGSEGFAMLYDLVELVGEGVADESSLLYSLRVSAGAANRMLSFMLEQGYVKTAREDSEFKITVLGSSFLQEYEGMRKFLS